MNLPLASTAAEAAYLEAGAMLPAELYATRGLRDFCGDRAAASPLGGLAVDRPQAAAGAPLSSCQGKGD